MSTSESGMSSGSSGTGTTTVEATAGTTSSSHIAWQAGQGDVAPLSALLPVQQQTPSVLGLPFTDVSPPSPASSDSDVPQSQPKGLIDGLSRFFTPSNKRKSRVSLNSGSAGSSSAALSVGKITNVSPSKTSPLLESNRTDECSDLGQNSKIQKLHDPLSDGENSDNSVGETYGQSLGTVSGQSSHLEKISAKLSVSFEVPSSPDSSKSCGLKMPVTGLSVLEKLEAEFERETADSGNKRKACSKLFDVSAPVTFHKSGKKYKVLRRDRSGASSAGQKMREVMMMKKSHRPPRGEARGEPDSRDGGKGKPACINLQPSLMHVTD